MAEYIEREALIILMIGLYEHHLEMMNYSSDSATLDCLQLAQEAPAADVVEVRHGVWKLMGTEMFMDGSYDSKFYCSLCGREIGVCHEHDNDKYKYAKSLYPYCHCGAKMDGKEHGV